MYAHRKLRNKDRKNATAVTNTIFVMRDSMESWERKRLQVDEMTLVRKTATHNDVSYKKKLWKK